MPQLGQMQYYLTQTNSDDVYTASPWGGNVPYGYQALTRDAFISGLTAKLTRVVQGT